jgi:Uma2 family endonuclease
MPLAKEDVFYTYADFLEWDESIRAEIMDGEIVMMSPPLRIHQELVTRLIILIGNFLKDKPCKLYPSPFAVRLNPEEDNSDDTVLEPDIIVVCDPSKLDDRGCNGAPDLVIEILSPSTSRYDRVVKYRKYQNAGVKEYWIVDPDTKTAQVCILEEGGYMVIMYDDTDTVPVAALPGLKISMAAVFAD